MPVRYMPPNDDPDLKAYILFPNAGGGFGHALTERGYETSTGYAYPEGYHRTVNMSVESNGAVLTPSFADTAGSVSVSSYASRMAFAIPWVDNSTVPVPIVVSALAQSAWTIKNNANALDTSALTGFYWDGVLFADDTGTAMLYAATVSSLVTLTAGKLNKRTVAGVWSESSTTVAKHLCVAAGNIWRASNDYTVSKCPAGSDPMTSTNFGANFQVGTNDAKITSMGATGSVVWVGKEDGVWEYKEADARFENVLPTNPHPQNFRWMKSDGEGGLLTAPYDGSLVRISQFGSITVYHPLRNKKPGRDTPKGTITNAVAIGDAIYCTMDGGRNVVQPSGIAVLKTTDNFSTFTSYTSESTDASMATVATISSLDTLANGDALLVGFNDQFMAIEFIMVAANSNAASISVSVSTGAGTWSSSILMTDETAAFFYSGIMTLDLTDFDLTTWVTATYNSTSRYWVRITTSAALDASTTIGEIGIVPRRTGPAFVNSVNNSSSHMEATGIYSQTLRLRLDGDTPTWDTIYTHTNSSASEIVLSPAQTDNSLHASLWVLGNKKNSRYAFPATPNPQITPYPILAKNEIAFGSIYVAPIFYPSTVNLADRHRCEYIDVYTKDLTGNVDTVRVAVKMGSFEEWYVSGDMKQRFNRFEFKDAVGDELSVAVQLLDGAATDPSGPYITNIVAWLREVDDGGKPPRSVVRATPEIS